jgi:hypothetical protein
MLMCVFAGLSNKARFSVELFVMLNASIVQASSSLPCVCEIRRNEPLTSRRLA